MIGRPDDSVDLPARISMTEQIVRITAALTVAGALAVFSTLCSTAQSAAESTTPEIGIRLPIARGPALAAYAAQLADSGAAPGRVALWSVLAARTSPLRAQAFAAAAITTRDAVLADPLIEHAHSLSRRDPALLRFMIRRAAALRDYHSVVTYADELLRQTQGSDKHCGMLAGAMADERMIPHLARVLGAAPRWRICFFAAAPGAASATAHLATLAQLLSRGPNPLSRAEAKLSLQHVLAMRDGARAEHLWRIVTRRTDSFAWPTPDDDGAVLPFDWTPVGGATWDDRAGRTLHFDLEGGATVPVATKIVALKRGSYRVVVSPADSIAMVRYQCADTAQSLANGAVLNIDRDCAPGTLELIGSARAASVSSARLMPVSPNQVTRGTTATGALPRHFD